MILDLSRKRVVSVIAVIFCAALLFIVKSGLISKAETKPVAAAFAPAIMANKKDALVTDADGDGIADPGDTIEYTVTINNTAGAGNDATGMIFTDTLESNLTLVVGSVNASPIAGDDSYQTVGNTQLQVGTSQTVSPSIFVSGNVLTNDIDPGGAAPTAVALTNAATTQGGLVTMQTNGTFVYTPPANFTGTDTFTYQATDGTLTGAGTVSISVIGMVRYVRNNAPAGGDGRSNTPFNTLLGGQTGTTGVTIYVFTGDGTTTNQSNGIALVNNQRLIGAGVALTMPGIMVNGTTNPTILAAGSAPAITNSAGSNGVSVGTAVGVEIQGLTIGGNQNAIDATFTGTTSGSLLIANNTITSVGLEGIDINGGSSGTISLAVNNNNVTSGGNGIDIDRTAGTVRVTSFSNNMVMGNTGASGIVMNSVVFDADGVAAGFQTVNASTLTIGQVGNGVSAGGINLQNVTGDLGLTDLDIFADNGAALIALSTGAFNAASSTGFRIVTTANAATFSATNGAAADITNATVDLQLASLVSTNSTSAGVNLNTVSGTFSAPAGSTITNASNADFSISGATNPTVTYGGTITDDVGALVSITGQTGGTKSFTGAITDNNDGDGTEQGISLINNTGATITFSGGLLIRTTTNAAFTATGGGTVNVCDENPCNSAVTGALINTLTTTTATSLNVANTTIGTNNLEFRSISSSGGSNNGIILDTTGTSGGLIVNGDGANTSVGGNSTGGTISNKSGADGSTTQGTGIYLNNTSNVVLRRMTISGINQNFGIRGFSVNNFMLEYSTVGSPTPTNAGTIAANLQGTTTTGIGEGAIYFGNQTNGTLGLTGTGTFTNNNISAGRSDNMQVSNGGGTLNRLNITGTVFGYNSAAVPRANAALTVTARRASSGNTVLNSTVTGNTFVGSPGNAANFTGQEPTTSLGISMDTIFQNNTITNNHAGNTIGGSNLTIAGFSNTTFNVSNNNMKGANGSAITLQMGAPVSGSTIATSLSGTLNNNIIGQSGVASSGSSGNGNGIFMSLADNATAPKGMATVAITNNQIYGITGNGAIFADNTGGAYNVNMTVTGNSGGTFGAGNCCGIATAAGAPLSADDVDVCAVITGNNFATASLPILVGVSTAASSMRLPNLTLSGTEANRELQAENFLKANNITGGVVDAYADNGATFTSNWSGGASPCTLPSTAPSLVEEEASASTVEFEEFFNFQNISYQTPLEMLAKIDPFGNHSANTAQILSTEERTMIMGGTQENALEDNKAKTIAATFESQSNEILTKSYLTKIFASIDELIDRLSSAIAPTVSAQSENVKETKPNAVNAPLSGETVTVNGAGSGFTIPAGKSVTIKFRVTINGQPPLFTQVSNQGTVSGSNFANVLTDDPETAAIGDATVTVIDATTIAVASSQNPSIVGQSVTFTATLTGSPVHASGNPSGTVQFFDAGTPIGSPVAVVAGAVNVGTAQLVVSDLAAGNHTITAQYGGGGQFNANTGSLTSNPQVVGNTAVWDGSADTNWNTAANWATNSAPFSGNDVSIPSSGVTNNPAISATDITIGSLTEISPRVLTINSGRTLTVTNACAVNGTMNVAGSFSCGSFSSTGTVNFTGTAAQSAPAFTYNNVGISNAAGVSLSGNAMINGVLTLGSGNVNSGANTLIIGSSGSITRTAGYVVGNLQKVFGAAGASFVFHVGTTGYSPATISNTVGTGSFTVKANDGFLAGTDTGQSIQRNWSLTSGGITQANIAFQYLQADVPAGTNEANFKFIRRNGAANTMFAPTTVDTTNNIFTLNGVNSFSDWTLGNNLAPTVASVNIGGRVVTAAGRGISKAMLTLTDTSGNVRSAITNPFGYYSFADISAGQVVILSVKHKGYEFAQPTLVLQVNEDLVEVNFTAMPASKFN